jgi:hypothetical protein
MQEQEIGSSNEGRCAELSCMMMQGHAIQKLRWRYDGENKEEC